MEPENVTQPQTMETETKETQNETQPMETESKETVSLKDATLTTQDGKTFTVSGAFVEMSTFLTEAVSDHSDDDQEAICVPNVKSEVFEQVKAICDYHLDKDTEPIPYIYKGTRTTRMEDIVDRWYADYLKDLDKYQLREIIYAADFLGIKKVVDLISAKFLTIVNGLTPDEILKEFKEDYDPEKDKFTEELYQEIVKKHPFILEM